MVAEDEAIEEDDTVDELMELVLPGSEVFDDRILPLLHSSYLYDDSRKCFQYSSAHLVNSHALQTRYATFRAEKRECGYTETELEESFGFLLFDDEDKATELGRTGLRAGHATCSTIGDPSKGVYVSKHSDCLDLKPWYSGKTGHVAIMKITKGRVKEVTENYTLKFTPPTAGFDCHESDQMLKVTAATSSFLAFERTQYYMYEIPSGGEDTDVCPRHVLPFAIVAFSYGKLEAADADAQEESLRMENEEKTAFDYKPWTGQLAVDSVVLHIGLKSQSGALLPAKLPEVLTAESVMRVSDLKAVLPKEVFQTCFSGEILVGGKCCSLYEVFSTDEEEDDSSLFLLTNGLQEKDLALVFLLSDSGVLIMLHSAYFLSYEGAGAEEVDALYGLFIFPDSHVIHKDSKNNQRRSALSLRISKVLPALNFAETEVEKSLSVSVSASASAASSTSAAAAASLSSAICDLRLSLEPHLRRYGALIQPAVASGDGDDDGGVPQREAAMFPDQYDCIAHLTYPLPRWTDLSRLRVATYFQDPASFVIPLKRAAELVRQHQGRDEDDDVYYYISSPEPEEPLPSSSSCGGGKDGGVTDVPCSAENSATDVPCSAENSATDIACSAENSAIDVTCSAENSVIDVTCSAENSVDKIPCSLENSAIDASCSIENSVIDASCSLENSVIDASCSAENSVDKIPCTEDKMPCSKDNSVPDVPCSVDNSCTDILCITDNRVIVDKPCNTDKSSKDTAGSADSNVTKMQSSEANISKDSSITEVQSSEANVRKDMPCSQVNASADMPHDSDKSGKDVPPLPERTTALHPDVVSDTCSADSSITKMLSSESNTSEDSSIPKVQPSESNGSKDMPCAPLPERTSALNPDVVSDNQLITTEEENLIEHSPLNASTTTTSAVPNRLDSSNKVPSEKENLPERTSPNASTTTTTSAVPDRVDPTNKVPSQDPSDSDGCQLDAVSLPESNQKTRHRRPDTSSEEQKVEEAALSTTLNGTKTVQEEERGQQELSGQINPAEVVGSAFETLRALFELSGSDSAEELEEEGPKAPQKASGDAELSTGFSSDQAHRHTTETGDDGFSEGGLNDDDDNDDDEVNMPSFQLDQSYGSEESDNEQQPFKSTVKVDIFVPKQRPLSGPAKSPVQVNVSTPPRETDDASEKTGQRNVAESSPLLKLFQRRPYLPSKGSDTRKESSHRDSGESSPKTHTAVCDANILAHGTTPHDKKSVRVLPDKEKSSDKSNDDKLTDNSVDKMACSEENSVTDVPCSADKSCNDSPCIKDNRVIVDKPCNTDKSSKDTAGSAYSNVTKMLSSEANISKDSSITEVQSSEANISKDRPCSQVNATADMPHDSDKSCKDVPALPERTSALHPDVVSDTSSANSSITKMRSSESNSSKDVSITKMQSEDMSPDKSSDDKLVGRRSSQRVRQSALTDKDKSSDESNDDKLVGRRFSERVRPRGTAPHDKKSVSALSDKEKISDKSNDDKLVGRRFSERVRPHGTTPHDKKPASASERVRRSAVLKKPEASDKRGDVSSSTDSLVVGGDHTPVKTPTRQGKKEKSVGALSDKDKSSDQSNDDKLRRVDASSSTESPVVGDHTPVNTPTSQSEKKKSSSLVVSEKKENSSPVNGEKKEDSLVVSEKKEDSLVVREKKEDSLVVSEKKDDSSLVVSEKKEDSSLVVSEKKDCPVVSVAAAADAGVEVNASKNLQTPFEPKAEAPSEQQPVSGLPVPPVKVGISVPESPPREANDKPQACLPALSPAESEKENFSPQRCSALEDVRESSGNKNCHSQYGASAELPPKAKWRCDTALNLSVSPTKPCSVVLCPSPMAPCSVTLNPSPSKHCAGSRHPCPPQADTSHVTPPRTCSAQKMTPRPQIDTLSLTPCPQTETLPVSSHPIPAQTNQSSMTPLPCPRQAETLTTTHLPQKDNLPLTSVQQRETVPVTPVLQKETSPAIPRPQQDTCSVTPCPSPPPPSAEQPTCAGVPPTQADTSPVVPPTEADTLPVIPPKHADTLSVVTPHRSAPTSPVLPPTQVDALPVVPPTQADALPVVTPSQSPPPSHVTPPPPPPATCNQTEKVSEEEGGGSEESREVSDGSRQESPSVPGKLSVPSDHPCKTDKEEVVRDTSPIPAKTQRPLESDKEEKNSVCTVVGLGTSVVGNAEVLPKEEGSNGSVPVLNSPAREVREKGGGPLSKSRPLRSQTAGPVADSSSEILHQCPPQPDTLRVTPPPPCSAQMKPSVESGKTGTLSLTPCPQTETLPVNSHLIPTQSNPSSVTPLPCPRQAENLTTAHFPQKENLPLTSVQQRETVPATPVQQKGTTPATPCPQQDTCSVTPCPSPPPSAEQPAQSQTLPVVPPAQLHTLPVTHSEAHTVPVVTPDQSTPTSPVTPPAACNQTGKVSEEEGGGSKESLEVSDGSCQESPSVPDKLSVPSDHPCKTDKEEEVVISTSPSPAKTQRLLESDKDPVVGLGTSVVCSAEVLPKEEGSNGAVPVSNSPAREVREKGGDPLSKSRPLRSRSGGPVTESSPKTLHVCSPQVDTSQVTPPRPCSALKKPSVDEKSWKRYILPKTETLPVISQPVPAQTETLPLTPQSVKGEVQLRTRPRAQTETAGPASPLSRRVRSSVALAKRDAGVESDSKSPPSAADHNYSLRSQKQTPTPSPPQREKSAEKDVKARRRRQRIDYRKLAKGEEATCEEKNIKKRTRHVAGLDVKMIITDCGSVFVPHGSDMQPEDVQLVRKRRKDNDCKKGLSSTSGSTGPETQPSTTLLPDSTDYSGKVEGGEAVKDEKGQKCLSRSPDGGPGALKMDQEQDQEAVDDEAEVFFTFLSSGTEEPAESDMDASSSMAADASGTAGGSEDSERKIRNKRKYTVTPTSGLKAVFRAGRRSRSLGASLLKQWQKISSKDIFKEPGSSADGDMSFAKELQGSDDGSSGSVLLEIPLDPIPEPASKDRTKKRRSGNGNDTDLRGKSKGTAGPTPPATPQLHHKRELRASVFQQQRRIVQNGELIEVSRTWSETYDFGLDSKFVKNPHDATVSRALHGPWNFDESDSEEETNLIFHIWIGLFYSQTAPRFFHSDPHQNQNPLQKDKPDLIPLKPDFLLAKRKDSAAVALSKAGTGTSTEFLSGATQAVHHSVKGSGQHHSVSGVYAYVVDPMASMLMLSSVPSDPLDLSGNKHHGDPSVSQAVVEVEARPVSPTYEALDLSIKGKKRPREDDDEEEEDEDRVAPGNTAAGVGVGGGGETEGGRLSSVPDVNMPLDMRTLVTCTWVKGDGDDISSTEKTVTHDCETPAAAAATSPSANTLKHAHTTASSHSAPLRKEAQGNNNPASSHSTPLKKETQANNNPASSHSTPLKKEGEGDNNPASSSSPLKKEALGSNNPASCHSATLKEAVLGNNNPASSSAPLKREVLGSNSPASSSAPLKKESLGSNNPASSAPLKETQGNNNPSSSHSATLKKEAALGSNNPVSSTPLRKEALGNILTVSSGPQGRSGKVVVVVESTHVSSKKEASGNTATAAISAPSGSREEEEAAAVVVKRAGSNSEDSLRGSGKEFNIAAVSSTLAAVLAGRQMVHLKSGSDKDKAAMAKTAGSSAMGVSGVHMAELKRGSAPASIELSSAPSLSGKETVEVKCGSDKTDAALGSTDRRDAVSGTTAASSSTLGLSGELMSSGKPTVELRHGSDKEVSKGSAASGNRAEPSTPTGLSGKPMAELRPGSDKQRSASSNRAEPSTAPGLSGIPMVELKRVPVKMEAASGSVERTNAPGLSGKGAVDLKRVSEKQDAASGSVERTNALGLSGKGAVDLKRVSEKQDAASSNVERTNALGLSGKGAVDLKCLSEKQDAASGNVERTNVERTNVERTNALGLSGKGAVDLKRVSEKQDAALGNVERTNALGLSGKEMGELKRVPVRREAASANSEPSNALAISGKGAVELKHGSDEQDAASGKVERTSAPGLSGKEMGESKGVPEKLETASGKAELRTALGLSGKEMVEMFGRLQEDRNLGVAQDAGDVKYRFYILETSDDAFFRETKEQLEADGHVAVGTQQLDLVRPGPSSSSSSSSASSSSPLLVVVRNQDIANHICQIPALLSLKSSPNVVFAGVDRPDDVRLHTHEELFSRGGFILYDGAKFKQLTLACMERVVSLLRQLGRKGKWKWHLHYRDSRALREEARTSEEARKKKHFLDGCQEAGLVEVLPYHDCDIMSRDPPPYLPCLVRLQAQNVMRRFPVFITGQTDDSFGSSGIFTTDTFF